MSFLLWQDVNQSAHTYPDRPAVQDVERVLNYASDQFGFARFDQAYCLFGKFLQGRKLGIRETPGLQVKNTQGAGDIPA